MSQEDEWNNIWEGVAEFHEWFPDGMVLIGGVAVWLHGQDRLDADLLETSHDADLLLSRVDYADLRDLEEVSANRALSKYQVIKNGVSFDVYVGNQNDLAIPYDDAAQCAVEINGYRVMALEHLIVLKCDATSGRTGAKRDKDIRDLQRMVLLCREPNADVFGPYLADEHIGLLSHAGKRGDLFQSLAGGNKHRGATLKRSFDANLQAIRQAAPYLNGDEPVTPISPMSTMTPIPNPEPLRGFDLPPGKRVGLSQLCAACGVRCAVTGGPDPVIVLTPDNRLRKGYTRDRTPAYCIGEDLLRDAEGDAERAWRVLEHLAYGVFDYRARETLSAARERVRIGRDDEARNF